MIKWIVTFFFSKWDYIKTLISKENKDVIELHKIHNQVARDMCKKHITKRYLKKGCSWCDLTGVVRIIKGNLVKPCRCVHKDLVMAEWKKYAKKFPSLKMWHDTEEE